MSTNLDQSNTPSSTASTGSTVVARARSNKARRLTTLTTLTTGLLAAAGLAAASAATSCDQPKPFCIVSPAPFGVKLVEQSREGDCEGFGPASFDADPRTGVSPYYELDKKGQPDYTRGSIAIQTSEITGLTRKAEENKVANTASGAQKYSMGKFESDEPDAENVCKVPTLSDTRVKLAAIPEVPDDPATEEMDGVPGQPAQDITLSWSNVRIVVSAALFGTQFSADLTDKRVSESGGTCTIKYKAVGISPAATCYKSDEMGNPAMKDGLYETDPEQCNSEANPDAGRFTGSGISPLTDVECSPQSGYCVLKGTTVPAYKE